MGTTAKLLDGKALAARLLAELKDEIHALPRAPEIACLWIGDAGAAESYRRGIARACGDLGIRFHERGLPAEAGEKALLAELEAADRDPAISGILLQRPLPKGVDPERILAALDPRKDIEGVTPNSLGMLVKGKTDRAPCTARAAVALARASGIDLKGAEAVVIGQSEVVGKPAALLLVEAHATVTICRRATKDLAFHTRRADVLVVAAGSPGLVQGDMLKPGAVVVDVGINAVKAADGKTRLVGDVDFASASGTAGWITPVPGGVGPVTVALLLGRAAASARSGLA